AAGCRLSCAREDHDLFAEGEARVARWTAERVDGSHLAAPYVAARERRTLLEEVKRRSRVRALTEPAHERARRQTQFADRLAFGGERFGAEAVRRLRLRRARRGRPAVVVLCRC